MKKQYISGMIVLAKEMTEEEYVRKHTPTKDIRTIHNGDGDKVVEGYAVQYADEHVRFLPKEIFEHLFRKMDKRDFYLADCYRTAMPTRESVIELHKVATEMVRLLKEVDENQNTGLEEKISKLLKKIENSNLFLDK